MIAAVALWACQSGQPPAAEPPPPPDEPPLLSLAPPTAHLATYREMWADRVAPRHPSDGGGRFERRDGHAAQVGAPSSFALRYTVGNAGVALGGALSFVPEPFWGWSPPQVDHPDGPGFVEVTAPDGVLLQGEAIAGQLVLTVSGRALRPDEVIDLTYGAGQGARVDRFAEPEAGLYLGVDGDGDGVRQWVWPAPTVRVEPGPARQLWVTLPSTAAEHTTVRLTVAALDAGANAHAPGVDQVDLQLPEGWEGPRHVSLNDGVGEARLTTGPAGIGQVVATAQGMVARTNPVVVRDGAPRVLWADLQIHTGRSDGTGTPATAYRYARDVAGLDAAAVTDHDRFGMHFLDAEPALWAEAQREADAATRDGFVAFPAYEWTSWVFGHRHVLYVADPGPVWSSLDPATDTPDELWEALAPYDALTLPHHPAGGPVPIDWSFVGDPEVEPVVEVVSVHGQSESPTMPQPIYDARGDAWVGPLLQSGRRLGLIGSTDGHDGHPGLAHLVGQGSGGLAALVDAKPTRAGIAEALRARRVYATNGVRTFVRFEGNGQPIGSVLPAGEVELVLRVVATADIIGAELVGRDGAVERIDGSGPALFHRWSRTTEPGDLFYVRLVQADGGLVWTSPLWFDSEPTSEPPDPSGAG